jgi:hypothetical protein
MGLRLRGKHRRDAFISRIVGLLAIKENGRQLHADGPPPEDEGTVN